MELQSLVDNLLEEDTNKEWRSKTLILVLGDESRLHIEKNLKASPHKLSSVNAVMRSRNDIEVLFLDRLQYLFMYLMKWEAEAVGYNNLVLYGLDELIYQDQNHENDLNSSQLRLANLIFNAAFRIKRKYCLKEVSIINRQEHTGLRNTEEYWRRIC